MNTSSRVKVPIIQQIEKIVADVPGWSPIDQLYTLFQVAYLTAGIPGDIIEVGSWCGRSTIAMGLAVQLTKTCNLHCIDLFPDREDWYQNADGSYSFQVSIRGRTYGGYQDQTVWKEPFEKDIAPLYKENPSLLARFKDNINRAGLSDKVLIYHGTSAEFVAAVPRKFRCRLAFIDGDHSYAAVRADIENIEPHLSPNGWICFDDAFSSYEGVNRAINDCIINSGQYDQCQQMTRKFFIARKTS